MAAAADLILLALKKAGVVGVGQSAKPEDTLDAFAELNLMFAEWSADNLVVFTKDDIVFQSTGAQSYTIGPGMDFNCPRPEQIQFGFARQPNGAQPADYQLRVIQTFEEYNEIFLKNLGAFPAYVFYDGGFPTGNVKFWPVISNIFEIHLSVMQPIAALDDPADDLNLPDKYQVAALYNLTERLGSNYTLPVDPTVSRIAAKSLLTIKRSNKRTPNLELPSQLVGSSRYNIFGDTVR
ncbi:MAG TPA: hypothetical protein VL424_14345 [Pararobbsia sp.]|jgi:hypothetical protein|nr:hypothetical protein [Pararobbsia sp.]